MPVSASGLASQLGARFTEDLHRLLEEARRVALVGVPGHDNLGDAAILMGELRALANLGVDVVHLSTVAGSRLSDLDDLDPDVPLLLHGGGNFGDLWPSNQQLREAIIERYLGRRIIMLPQTLHFGDPKNALKAAAVFRRHNRLTIMVRDSISETVANETFDNHVVLSPDAAFTLTTQKRRAANRPAWWLARTDQERLPGEAAAPDGWRMHDWPSPLKDGRTLRRIYERVRRRVRSDAGPQGVWVRREIMRRSARRLDQAFDALLAPRFVVTERMHGHILCLTADIPHIVVDNSYGKTSSLVSTWTQSSPETRLARDRAEALVMLQSLGLTHGEDHRRKPRSL